MLLKSLLVLIASAFLANGSLPTGHVMRPDDKASYVKLEVRGTLFHQSSISYIRTNDSSFPDAKLVVKLERNEDKNPALDRYLQELNGKPVVANGFLDCRRISQEPGIIYMYLTSESQIERPKKSESE